MKTFQFVRILINPKEKDFDSVISDAVNMNGLVKTITATTVNDEVHVYVLIEYNQQIY